MKTKSPRNYLHLFMKLFGWTLAIVLIATVGCRRSNDDDFDERTLEKKPYTEGEEFPDKDDPFRP